MPTEIFTIAQFESALPVNKLTQVPLWSRVHSSTYGNEVCYNITVIPNYATIRIQSSISASTGVCAPTAKDSIRAYIINPVTSRPLCGKVQRWVARTRNWRLNLTRVLRELYHNALLLGPCPRCASPTALWVSKSRDNYNRPYIACTGATTGPTGPNPCGGWLCWVDDPSTPNTLDSNTTTQLPLPLPLPLSK